MTLYYFFRELTNLVDSPDDDYAGDYDGQAVDPSDEMDDIDDCYVFHRNGRDYRSAGDARGTENQTFNFNTLETASAHSFGFLSASAATFDLEQKPWQSTGRDEEDEVGNECDIKVADNRNRLRRNKSFFSAGRAGQDSF